MTRELPRQTLWQATCTIPRRAPLLETIRVDACVIGAGIAGLMTAYQLAADGARVAVIEDGRIGEGMTSHTTAHLTCALDDRYFQLARLHGQEGARLAAASHAAAIDALERIVRNEGIACGFERLTGYLFTPEATAATSSSSSASSRRRTPRDSSASVASTPRQEPRARSDAVSRSRTRRNATRCGCSTASPPPSSAWAARIHCGTHAASVKDGTPVTVTTARGHTIEANDVVVATNVPVNDLLAIHTKQAPYTTYVVAVEAPASEMALWWDTREEGGGESGDVPYHYVRLHREGDEAFLIVGGEDHKSGQADDGISRYDALEQWARERWSGLGEVRYRWAGQVMEPIDGLAYIGRNPGDEHVYVVTGDSGNGMTHGAIAGLLIADLVAGRANPWTSLYDPSRKPVVAAADFVKENLNVAAQYVKDYAGPADLDDPEALARGQGGVVRRGVARHAVYRDDAGTLHEFTAVCPHLGCVVHWNPAARTFDCPCHGSRFDARGRVINGPANRDLERVTVTS
jgi:glycine/D-amino acid oxidase-like deaminating enzyme/nitrite reductase/ring-hydroxylating ferredoxin subunit